MKNEENHVSIKAEHWTVAARSFLTLTTNVKHTTGKLRASSEGDAPVSRSGIPVRVLLPFLRCLERSPRIIPPEPLWESSFAIPRAGRDHRDPSPGAAGVSRAQHVQSQTTPHIGVVTSKRTNHRFTWAWL